MLNGGWWGWGGFVLSQYATVYYILYTVYYYTLYYSILYYTILYYIILSCAVLCYDILCCTRRRAAAPARASRRAQQPTRLPAGCYVCQTVIVSSITHVYNVLSHVCMYVLTNVYSCITKSN